MKDASFLKVIVRRSIKRKKSLTQNYICNRFMMMHNEVSYFENSKLTIGNCVSTNIKYFAF